MKPWSFLHISDLQPGSPRSYRFNQAMGENADTAYKQLGEVEDVDLLLVGGDLTRDGAIHNFECEEARDRLGSLPYPFYAIPGNMDTCNKHTSVAGATGRDDPRLNVTAEQLDHFALFFGEFPWSFVHKEVRFTGFCASIAGSGLPQEQRLWSLLENIPNLPKSRHHIALMHYWPFMETPDEPAWDMSDPDEYWNWYFSIDPPHRQRLLELLHNAQVEILFCGHVHTGRRVQQVEGMRLYRCPASGITAQLAERWSDSETRQGFHLCEVNDQGIEVTFVPGDDQCEEFDTFGPWGHPPVSERDYSVAREDPPLQPDSD